MGHIPCLASVVAGLGPEGLHIPRGLPPTLPPYTCSAVIGSLKRRRSKLSKMQMKARCSSVGKCTRVPGQWPLSPVTPTALPPPRSPLRPATSLTTVLKAKTCSPLSCCHPGLSVICLLCVTPWPPLHLLPGVPSFGAGGYLLLEGSFTS